MLPFTDSFVGPDQDLVDRNPIYLDLDGPWAVDSNTAICATGDQGVTVVNDPGFLADQFAEALFNASTDSGNYMGVCVRATLNNWYMFFSGNGLTRLKKVIAGVEINLGSGVDWFAPGDVMRLEVVGNVLTPYKNGVVADIGPVIDSDLASGVAGLWGSGFGGAQNIGSLTVGNMGGAAGPSLWPLGIG